MRSGCHVAQVLSYAAASSALDGAQSRATRKPPTWPPALSELTTASPAAVSGAPGFSAVMAASCAASRALYCAVWSLEGLMM